MPKNAYKLFSALSARHRRRRLKNNSHNITNEETFCRIHPPALSSATQPDHHHLQALPIGNFPASSLIKEGYTDITHTDREPVENDENEDGYVYLQNISDINIETIEPESDSESSGTDEPSDVNIAGFSLREWAVNEAVNHKQLNALLKLLHTHKCFSYLPLDARTLLKTPRAYEIKNIGSGQYCHLGVKDSIIRILNLYPTMCLARELHLQCNIDGLPISKSSNSCIWPILIAFTEFPQISPLTVGIYHGNGKPESCSLFLSDFVKEIVELVNNGIIHSDSTYKIVLDAYICDAPARAYLAQIKGHTGYGCCSKCTINGRWVSRRIIFDDITNSHPRTHENFVNQVDKRHHLENSLSPLLQIPGIDMVTQFPFEYMHLVCLGVMRKILLCFLKGDSYDVRISTNLAAQISNSLISIRTFIPIEFSRKPRSLTEILRWKATELRQLLLYTSPFVFHKFLKPEVEKHFLAFHFAIRILVSPHYVVSLIEYARALLRYFVVNFNSLYGVQNVSYNVHGLLHLADDVNKFGPLDKFSAFKFENKLQKLKKLIRKHDKPLQQLVRRIKENFCTNSPSIQFCQPTLILHERYSDCAVYPVGLHDPSYRRVTIHGFKITTKQPNHCVIMNSGDICIVDFIATNENNEPFFYGRKFRDVGPFYTKPERSTTVGIYLVKKLSHGKLYPIKEIKSKAMKIPIQMCGSGDSHYIAELLHHS